MRGTTCMGSHGAACVHCTEAGQLTRLPCGCAARATSAVPTHCPQAEAERLKATSWQLGCTQCSLTTVEKNQTVSSAACPLDVFCLITLSNHFLLLLGFLHFLSLNHRRVFEVCSAPSSALYVLSGRGYGVQYEYVPPDLG